ncbi:MAG TPA: hemolysin family protein [Anaerohalosphaeraceae bacterium]|mgnify:CR=1 FL=1|nr:hemolysin family protein [Anaerohalosphaeraceae bacterium]
MSDVTGSILLLSGLTLLSLFLSLNNQALQNFSMLKLQEAFRRAGREDRVEELLRIEDRLTIACSILRLLANAGILLILVHLMAGKHYLLTLGVAFIILELFAVIIPHSWGKHAGEFILPRTYGLLKGLMWLTRPFLYIADLHDRIVRRLAGIQERKPEEAQEEKQEEILGIVEQGKIEGVVDEEEMEMIENVLELDETTAAEIMTPRTELVAVPVDADLSTVLEAIGKEGHSRIPIYEGTIDSIVGMLYAKDLLPLIGKDPAQFNLREKMRKPYFVPESKSLRDLLHDFQSSKLHIAVILDEYGGTAGLISIEDILEELVGEITDEYELSVPETFKRIDENTVDVDARTNIEDVNSELEIELPEEEDYETLGGFVFSYLGYIPKQGESFEYKDLKLTITQAEPRSVRRVKIQKPPEDSGGQ